MANKNEDTNKTAPPTPQQGTKPTIGGGASQSPQVLPGGKVVNTSLSVVGELPVFQAYPHH